jgi:hypothetical protein
MNTCSMHSTKAFNIRKLAYKVSSAQCYSSPSSPSQALQYIVDLGFLHSRQSHLSCDSKHQSDCEFDCIVFSTSLCFMGWGCQPTAQPPSWTSKVSLFYWTLTLDLSGLADPASSHVAAGIALEITGSHKPHCHSEVETLLGGFYTRTV